MPYTRKEVKFLLSSGSPLSAGQKAKMKTELHANPSLGHQKKGSAAMKRGSRSGNFKNQHMEVETHAYDFRNHLRKPPRKKR